MTIIELLLPPVLMVASLFVGYKWGQQDAYNRMKGWFKEGNTSKLIDVLGGDYWRITRL